MTTEETSHRIGLDCFYEGKQVKDKKSTLYTLFSKHVLEEVKKKFVVAAHKGGITYNEKVEGFDGRVGYRVKQVVEPIDIATAFNQIPTNEVNNNLVAYQNKLYDIMYQEFGKNWDDPLEKKILHELGYSYSETNRERIQAGIKKGDVRKMITTKYREVRKYIFQTIEKVHGRGKLNISRSRVNGSEKDGKLVRGGREKRKFYANASARKIKAARTENNTSAVLSEVELLKKQLAVLQEKMDREEEDRYIASLAVVNGREKKRRNKAKRETKTDNRKDREKSSKLSDDASDTSEFLKRDLGICRDGDKHKKSSKAKKSTHMRIEKKEQKILGSNNRLQMKGPMSSDDSTVTSSSEEKDDNLGRSVVMRRKNVKSKGMQEDISNDEDEEEDIMKTMQGESVTSKKGTKSTEMEDDDESDEELGQTKICDHTYLGLRLEDNHDYLAVLEDEGKKCGACDQDITTDFYRCNTCSFEYVCCNGCYGISMAENKRRRSPKKNKKYES